MTAKSKTETRPETTASTAELTIPDRIDPLDYAPYAEAHGKLKAMRERLAGIDSEIERLKLADPAQHEAARVAGEKKALLTGQPLPEAQSIPDMLTKLARDRRAVYAAAFELEAAEKRQRRAAFRALAEPFKESYRALGAEMARSFATFYRLDRELGRIERLFREGGGLPHFRRPVDISPERAWDFAESAAKSGLLTGDLSALMGEPSFREQRAELKRINRKIAAKLEAEQKRPEAEAQQGAQREGLLQRISAVFG